jgi:hypothetical protein
VDTADWPARLTLGGVWVVPEQLPPVEYVRVDAGV